VAGEETGGMFRLGLRKADASAQVRVMHRQAFVALFHHLWQQGRLPLRRGM
jgi:hypothetical protein